MSPSIALRKRLHVLTTRTFKHHLPSCQTPSALHPIAIIHDTFPVSLFSLAPRETPHRYSTTLQSCCPWIFAHGGVAALTTLSVVAEARPANWPGFRPSVWARRLLHCMVWKGSATNMQTRREGVMDCIRHRCFQDVKRLCKLSTGG